MLHDQIVEVHPLNAQMVEYTSWIIPYIHWQHCLDSLRQTCFPGGEYYYSLLNIPAAERSKQLCKHKMSNKYKAAGFPEILALKG
jgi:hypothetical protein